MRHGRERRFELDATPLGHARRALDEISRQWDDALARLRSYVEGAAETGVHGSTTPMRGVSSRP